MKCLFIPLLIALCFNCRAQTKRPILDTLWADGYNGTRQQPDTIKAFLWLWIDNDKYPTTHVGYYIQSTGVGLDVKRRSLPSYIKLFCWLPFKK